MSMLLSKFRGCMVGGLIGDCLGGPFEGDFPISKTVLKNFFNNILGGASNQIFPYTDDTCMTLSVAHSLVEKRKLDSNDMARRFVSEYYRNPGRGYGGNVINVFGALRDSNFEDVFLPARIQFNGSGSFGNGAAMRIAPIALFGNKKTDDFLKNAAEECSRLTHTHPFGYNGAILQCLAVHAALKLDSTKELNPVQYITDLEDKMKSVELKSDETPYAESLKRIKDIFLQKQEDISAPEIAEYLGNDVSARKSVPTAIYSFLRGMKPIPDFECSNPFVRTIYFAISVGGDTDTIATMAGSIAGAYYGIEAIPEELPKKCEVIEEIKKLSEKLYELSQEKSSS